MAIKQLLFVDTNIWLDFYRARTDAGLKLLEHVEAVSDKLISTYQVEMEFKKNRQDAILESLRGLKSPDGVQRPALFSDAQAVRTLNKNISGAKTQVTKLKTRMKKALENPALHDPVYKACQRLFHADSTLILSRDDSIRHVIRKRALKRFLHGCPPRKKNDTSIGDAINWEWMVECSLKNNAELVVVTRDSDYGASYEDFSYVNDHLKQEFAERVSRKRKILLYMVHVVTGESKARRIYKGIEFFVASAMVFGVIAYNAPLALSCLLGAIIAGVCIYNIYKPHPYEKTPRHRRAYWALALASPILFIGTITPKAVPEQDMQDVSSSSPLATELMPKGSEFLYNETDTKRVAWIMNGKSSIKQRLKDPDSAKFAKCNTFYNFL
jgi:hypothetical protein